MLEFDETWFELQISDRTALDAAADDFAAALKSVYPSDATDPHSGLNVADDGYAAPSSARGDLLPCGLAKRHPIICYLHTNGVDAATLTWDEVWERYDALKISEGKDYPGGC